MSFETRFLQLQFNNKKRTSFLTQLANLVEAGVPAPDALRHMRDAYKKKKNSLFALVAEKMSHNAGQGKYIAEGMEGWFPFSICKILCTSELRGILPEGLQNSILHLQSGARFLKPLSSTASGFFYVVTLLAAIAFVGHKYIPMIGQYSTDWPGISLTFYHFANFIYYDYPLIILLLIGLIFWINWSIRNYDNSYYKIVARPFMPLFNGMRAYEMLEIMALLSSNGVGIPEIISILKSQYKRGYLARKYSIMDARIRAGIQNMGDVIDTGIYTKAQISDLQLISRYIDEEDQAKIFRVMSKNIATSITSNLKVVAAIISASCLVLTGLGIVWIYGSYALLAASVS